MILRLSGKKYDHIRRCIHSSRVLENPYRVLGLQAGASKKEVKSAYRDLVKTCHPGTINLPLIFLVRYQKWMVMEIHILFQAMFRFIS